MRDNDVHKFLGNAIGALSQIPYNLPLREAVVAGNFPRVKKDTNSPSVTPTQLANALQAACEHDNKEAAIQIAPKLDLSQSPTDVLYTDKETDNSLVSPMINAPYAVQCSTAPATEVLEVLMEHMTDAQLSQKGATALLPSSRQKSRNLPAPSLECDAVGAACFHLHVDALNVLLKKRCDARTKAERSPLEFQLSEICGTNWKSDKKLLALHHVSPLHLALRGVKNSNSKANGRPLEKRMEDCISICKVLINTYGESILSSTDDRGNTCLHVTVMEELDSQLVDSFLAAGAKPTWRNGDGETPGALKNAPTILQWEAVDDSLILEIENERAIAERQRKKRAEKRRKKKGKPLKLPENLADSVNGLRERDFTTATPSSPSRCSSHASDFEEEPRIQLRDRFTQTIDNPNAHVTQDLHHLLELARADNDLLATQLASAQCRIEELKREKENAVREAIRDCQKQLITVLGCSQVEAVSILKGDAVAGEKALQKIVEEKLAKERSAILELYNAALAEKDESPEKSSFTPTTVMKPLCHPTSSTSSSSPVSAPAKSPTTQAPCSAPAVESKAKTTQGWSNINKQNGMGKKSVVEEQRLPPQAQQPNQRAGAATGAAHSGLPPPPKKGGGGGKFAWGAPVNQSTDDSEIDAKEPSNVVGEQPNEVPPQKNKQQPTWRAKNKPQQPMWRVKPINEDGRTTAAATEVVAKAVSTGPVTHARGGGKGSSSSKPQDVRRQVKPINEDGRRTAPAAATEVVEAVSAVSTVPVTHARGGGGRRSSSTKPQDVRREVPIDEDEFPRLGLPASFPKLGAGTKPQQRGRNK